MVTIRQWIAHACRFFNPNDAVANGTSLMFVTQLPAKGTWLTFTTPRCQQFEQVSGTRIARARCHAEVGAARDAPLVPRE